MQSSSFISRIIQTIIALASFALVLIIATGVLQIILFLITIAIVIWLLRRIPFIRKHTNNYIQTFIEVETNKIIYQAENHNGLEKDITTDSKVIEGDDQKDM